jgi:uncharacterized protein YndB with AHSA1/START domain
MKHNTLLTLNADNMDTRPLVTERTYKAPIHKVWAAITDKEQMKEWYFDLEEFEPRVGFKFQFTGEDKNAKYLHHCKILKCDPPHVISYSWTYPKYEGYSVVTWELFSEGDAQTRLRLTHEGLESFPQQNPSFRVESFQDGWNYFVNEALPSFVETEMVSKSVAIDASPAVIWDILLHPGQQWGEAFGGGTDVQTDWERGSRVIWTDAEGDIGAYGVVAEHRPKTYLQVDMYDRTDPEPNERPGEYSEKYELSESENSACILTIAFGPLAKKYIPEHGAMWDEALAIIKDLAESR